MEIKDFIYFDSQKALSILSQLDGRVITEVSEEIEESKDERNIRQYDLKLFKPEFGGVKSDKSIMLQTGIVHHNIFNLLESKLREYNLITYVNKDIEVQEDIGFLSNSLLGKYYVVVEGYVNFEDFRKLEDILKRFNNINEFINECVISSLKDTEEYRSSLENIKNLKEQAENIKDKNKKRYELKRVKEMEVELENNVRSLSPNEGVDEWLVKGIQLFMDTFFKDRIMIRVYPFEERAESHFIGNLKRDCFIDSSIDNIMKAYGAKPNIKLTMLGLITSVPTENGLGFDAMSEYDIYGDGLSDTVIFEKAFRAVFESMEGIEDFVKFSRFPNITVYPIAVYRAIYSG